MTDTCNEGRWYDSGRVADNLCTLKPGHKPIEKHSDGRVTWTEKLTVALNRADRRRARKGVRV